MKRYIWIIVLFFLPSGFLLAQDIAKGTPTNIFEPNAGHYIVAIIAGFVLAVAFSLILTNLSVAAGLQTLSINDNDKAGSKPFNRNQPRVHEHHHKNSKDENSVGENIRMISSAFGIWTLITATLSLFFASWLATELSLSSNPMIGAVIGLVIWGLFYVAMMTIEVSAISSLVGSLIKLASSGLKSAYNMTTSIFSKSDSSKIEDATLKVINSVKDEFFGDADDIKDQIQDYIKQLKPKELDPHQLAVEFAKVLNDAEIQAITHEDAFGNHDRIYLHLKHKGMEDSKARQFASKAGQIFNVVKNEKSKGKGMADTIIDSSMKAAGMSDREVLETRIKIEDYLRRTGKEELNPEWIKADLERMFKDPVGASKSLKERLSHIERADIARVMAENTDLPKDEAEARIDKIYSVIESIKSGAAGYLESTIDKLRNFTDSLDNPELRFDDITADIQRLFHDPKAGAESLLRRARSIDRNTIKNMLAQRKDISQEDAERIIQKIESVRDSVIEKVQEMQAEITRRLEDVKEEALYQAEEAKKVAATAAWWAFGTALISGVGAVLGGIIATSYYL